MVLPTHIADDSPREAWLNQIARILSFSERKLLVLVDEAIDAQLRPLFLRLRAEGHAPAITFDAFELGRLAPGTTVILKVREGDIGWLNANRPLVADRDLRVILFSSAETTVQLRRGAPDFFDWISHVVTCSPGAFGFAVAALRRAERIAGGVSWLGGDLDAVLREASPRSGHRVLRASREYSELLAEVKDAHAGWLVFEDAVSFADEIRIASLLAETGRWRRWIVHATEVLPFTVGAHAQAMALEDACRCLADAGHPEPCALAVLLDLEPEAIERAAAKAEAPAVEGGVPRALRSELRRALRAEDIGAEEMLGAELWRGVDLIEERLKPAVLGAPSRAPMLLVQHLLRRKAGAWLPAARLSNMCGAYDVAEALIRRELDRDDSGTAWLELSMTLWDRDRVLRSWDAIAECEKSLSPEDPGLTARFFRHRALLYRWSGAFDRELSDLDASKTAAGRAGLELLAVAAKERLAVIEAHLGDLEAGMSDIDDVRSFLSARFGPDHPSTIAASRSRAEILFARLRIRGVGAADVSSAFDEVIARTRQRFGAFHESLAGMYTSMSNLAGWRGDRALAEQRAQLAQMIVERAPTLGARTFLGPRVRGRRLGVAELRAKLEVLEQEYGIESSNSRRVILALAAALEREGLGEDALAVLEDALARLRDRRRLHPDRVSAQAIVAIASRASRMLLRRHERARARDVLYSNIEERPSASLDARTESELDYTAGLIELSSGGLDEAERLANDAHQRAPGALEATVLRAWILQRRGRDEEKDRLLDAELHRIQREFGPAAPDRRRIERLMNELNLIAG